MAPGDLDIGLGQASKDLQNAPTASHWPLQQPGLTQRPQRQSSKLLPPVCQFFHLPSPSSSCPSHIARSSDSPHIKTPVLSMVKDHNKATWVKLPSGPRKVFPLGRCGAAEMSSEAKGVVRGNSSGALTLKTPTNHDSEFFLGTDYSKWECVAFSIYLLTN